MAELPTADEFFGSPPAATPGQSAAAPTFDALMAQYPAKSAEPMNGPGIEEWLAHTDAGKVLDAFGQGAKQAWGAGQPGFSDEFTAFAKKVGLYNDAEKG